MKTAIDSYCYHRFFGEVYPQQSTPPSRMTLEDFLHRAHELEVGGVSLESCFIPRLDPDYLAQIRDQLDEYHLDRVFAWGHPDGLEGGANEHAYAEMIRCFVSAQNLPIASRVSSPGLSAQSSALSTIFLNKEASTNVCGHLHRFVRDRPEGSDCSLHRFSQRRGTQTGLHHRTDR